MLSVASFDVKECRFDSTHTTWSRATADRTEPRRKRRRLVEHPPCESNRPNATGALYSFSVSGGQGLIKHAVSGLEPRRRDKVRTTDSSSLSPFRLLHLTKTATSNYAALLPDSEILPNFVSNNFKALQLSIKKELAHVVSKRTNNVPWSKANLRILRAISSS
jgi:hypothetical protein